MWYTVQTHYLLMQTEMVEWIFQFFYLLYWWTLHHAILSVCLVQSFNVRTLTFSVLLKTSYHFQTARFYFKVLQENTFSPICWFLRGKIANFLCVQRGLKSRHLSPEIWPLSKRKWSLWLAWIIENKWDWWGIRRNEKQWKERERRCIKWRRHFVKVPLGDVKRCRRVG